MLKRKETGKEVHLPNLQYNLEVVSSDNEFLNTLKHTDKRLLCRLFKFYMPYLSDDSGILDLNTKKQLDAEGVYRSGPSDMSYQERAIVVSVPPSYEGELKANDIIWINNRAFDVDSRCRSNRDQGIGLFDGYMWLNEAHVEFIDYGFMSKLKEDERKYVTSNQIA